VKPQAKLQAKLRVKPQEKWLELRLQQVKRHLLGLKQEIWLGLRLLLGLRLQGAQRSTMSVWVLVTLRRSDAWVITAHQLVSAGSLYRVRLMRPMLVVAVS
jgi:hypothetical protein